MPKKNGYGNQCMGKQKTAFERKIRKIEKHKLRLETKEIVLDSIRYKQSLSIDLYPRLNGISDFI